ncbi:unnamed protein product [Ambrosiozyma monospora]|uniref:Unnamed protein product n=1 Tax=Ambrosiozyma monospora TaxID=43982 RepID=A0ACB5T2L2_AMBMO|nr:unnamed protein product [Ambrosiozyma monospora]
MVVQANNTLNLIEYRKRMLAVFLNRCLHSIEGIIENEFFINFFNPEVNFNDYLFQEHANIAKLNKYRVAVYDPLNNLDNQLYLTLPIPASSNLAMFPEMVNEEQFQNLDLVLKKFAKYEVILDNISKCNKRIIKHYNEVNANMSDMGSCFNKLSLLQDSDFIEEMGKNFERKLIYSNSLVELINLKFLDKLIELKNFTRTVKELIEFNRKKVLQYKLIEKELYTSRVKLKGYQKQQESINKIDSLIHSKIDDDENSQHNNDNNEAPITDAELQNALYISNNKNKTFYGKIPYLKKLNNAIQKYTDNDPDKTRKDKMYQLKLGIYKLERQYELLEVELGRMGLDVKVELTRFHDWFKLQLRALVLTYEAGLQEYLRNNCA